MSKKEYMCDGCGYTLCCCQCAPEDEVRVDALVSCHDAVFKNMCKVYPHEMYAQWPTEFIEYAKGILPGLSEDEIIRVLKKTEGN